MLGLGLDPETRETFAICDYRAGRVEDAQPGLKFLVEWVGYRHRTWEGAETVPAGLYDTYCRSAGLY